jgi:hypothetical protein
MHTLRGPQVLIVLLVLSYPTIASALGSPAYSSDAQWKREDIIVFREQFLAADRSFTPEARATAEARLSHLEHLSESMNPQEFIVELCRIAALADNGHTQCLPTWLGRDICRQIPAIAGTKSAACHFQNPDREVPDFSRVPIAFYPFGEEFNVIGVDAKDSNLLGSRLVSVENRPVRNIRATLRTFSGGTLALRDLRGATILSNPEELHAVGLSHRSDSVLYEFVTPSGRAIKLTFALARQPERPMTWHELPAADRAPWAFQDPGKPFRYRDAPEINSLVVQLRQILDGDREKIVDFLREAEAQREARGRKNIVLDMRFNGGGNFLLTRDLFIRWPARVPGQFFVLTSAKTFSAAITSIAYLKQAGTNRVSIIGEPVGDRLMFFSDGLPIQLPHSGRFFLPAVARMDYRDGCRQYDDCMEAIAQPGRPTATVPLPTPAPLERLPISVATLEPDVLAPWTIDSWLTGKDPMMDAVTTLIDGEPDNK